MPKFADKNSCTGCTACMSICPKQCIKMIRDESGFAYPNIANQSLCIECGLCECVCPVLKKRSNDKERPLAYAAFSKEDSLRMDSSSGGVFSEIAKLIFEKNGVVYGAAYNDVFEVYHCCVENQEDLHKLRGAKYAESNLENTFSKILEHLKQEQYVLFVGTPCQVAGLKSFVGKDYDNLICIDFVCHGVPSPMAWKEYVYFRAREDADGELPTAINLRSKISGWSKYQYSNMFRYSNGKEYSSVSTQNLFMKLFVGDYISRLSCNDCKFKGYERVSDITLGDFWGIWDIDSEMDDNKGTSVVLLQSEKGKALFESIADNLKIKQVSLEEASRYNPSMLVSSTSKSNREQVLLDIKSGGIKSCERLFVVSKPLWRHRIKDLIKRALD